MIRYFANNQRVLYIIIGTISVIPLIVHLIFSSLAISGRLYTLVIAFIYFGVFYIFSKLLLSLYLVMYKGNIKMLKLNKITAEFFILVPLLFLILGLWWQVQSFNTPEMMIGFENYAMIGTFLSAYHHWCKNYRGVTLY